MTQLTTSYFAAYKAEMGVAVRTSVGTPHWWVGELEHVRRITPYGCLGHDDWAQRYMARLDRLDPDDLGRRFEELSARHDGRPLALLCFEKARSECHRSLLADWLERHGFGRVPEAKPAQMHLEVER